MPTLFTPTRIKNLALPNRFIRSATWEGLAAENGDCTPELVELMEDLAGGNPGLIITGHAYVSPAGQATLRQLGVDHDGRIEGLNEMTAAVHRKGGRIIMQLAHGGLRADAKLSNMMPMGPSVAEGLIVPPGREMTAEDIRQFERDQAYFRRAAKSLKANIQAPVILIGGIRSYLLAERLVDEGFADYISMSRPFIREPRLIARWQSGDLRKATCISCNGCLGAARSGRGIYCVQDRKGTKKSKPSWAIVEVAAPEK